VGNRPAPGHSPGGGRVWHPPPTAQEGVTGLLGGGLVGRQHHPVGPI
jgi:hypothetical protein